MEKKVLTNEELAQLKFISEKRNNLTERFGLLEVQKETLKKELFNLLEEEKNIGVILQQKYGNGSINLELGEFIPG